MASVCYAAGAANALVSPARRSEQPRLGRQADTVDASTLERDAVASTDASVDDLMVRAHACWHARLSCSALTRMLHMSQAQLLALNAK